MADEFDFNDLTPVLKVVRYMGKKYFAQEASEGAAVAYRNASLKAAKMADGKVIGMEGAADVEPLLVHLCLFKTNDAGEKTIENVSLAEVRTWPSRIIRPIFDWIKEVSQLNEAETADGIKKQIAKLQQQLSTMEGSDPKDEPTSTHHTSG